MTTSFRLAWTAAVLAAVLPAAVAAAEQPPLLRPPASIDVAEGGAGSRTARDLVFTLDIPAKTDVTFYVSVGSQTWSAVDGVDFVPFAGRTVRIAKGQNRASVRFEVLGDENIEQDETVSLRTENIVGAWLDGSMQTDVVIFNDDVADATDWVVNRDEFEVRPHDTGPFDLSQNDFKPSWEWARSVGFTMQVLDAPGHGTVRPRNDAVFYYEPAEGFIGLDSFRYRLCVTPGDVCHDNVATMRVVPFVAPLSGEGHSGFRDIQARNVEGYRLVAKPLAVPLVFEVPTGVDPTPTVLTDAAGFGYAKGVVPASVGGATREYLLVVESESGPTVHVGVDANGDGKLSDAETSCRLARCLVPMQVGATPVRWIAGVHNDTEFPGAYVVNAYVVPMDRSDRTLTATGPGRQTTWGFEHVLVGWNDPTLVDGDWRGGVIRILAADGTTVLDLPVQVRRFGGLSQALPLVSGRPQPLALSGWTRQRHLFIDVPAGAQRLDVVVTGGLPGGTSFHVARLAGAIDPANPLPAPAPEATEAVATGSTATGGGRVTVQGGALAPGRWYIVPVNANDQDVALSVTATVDGLGPVLRPGSYYNPARSGSGVFLYPAAAEWTALWYTYLADGRPTWYYLQAAVPAANGLWHSPVYRATWNGTTRTLDAVGEATFTPVGGDAFTMTYTIDGVAGTQPMQPLGRGCPVRDGAPVNISSTWFDPLKAGTGYSVQTWPDYEYHAAFIYDEQGVPMFLAAERSGFGGDDATLTLQRLTGACPTCEMRAPVRTDVGTYVRRLVAGKLDTVEIDAVWQDGNPPYWLPPVSSWSAEDRPMLLGGAGTTQGCAP